jgi:hypothetical protein
VALGFIGGDSTRSAHNSTPTPTKTSDSIGANHGCDLTESTTEAVRNKIATAQNKMVKT